MQSSPSALPAGLDPYTARQNLLHHTYSPLISVQSSHKADILIQSILQNDNINLLGLLKIYGNNAKYSIPNQSFKITNNQLITKSYPSFPIRFEDPLPDLLSILNASSNSNSNSNPTSNSSDVLPSKLRQLFSISSLELLLKHTSSSSSSFSPSSLSFSNEEDLYLKFFNKIITSKNIVPFETFNHPVSQIFIIDYSSDDLDSLRKMVVDFRNSVFPKYFQIDDLLIHIFIIYDSKLVSDSDILNFQNLIKKNLSFSSTTIPILIYDDDMIKLYKNENSTIEEDLQNISLNQTSSHSNNAENYINVPKSVDIIFRNKIFEYINKILIPHMESKVRIWDDQILSPKKSFTGRFFSVSKKFFNNNNNTNEQLNNHTSVFNYQENSYYKSSTEQIIRKLADWSLILKDFKYAYSTYDFIKKDYTNDKAWVYVASTQEMCIVSLLLAQTQQISQLTSPPPDKNTLRKIRHDIIEPYIDNLSYTFKSRLNVKTYSIKTLVILIELLMCMCKSFNISWWWNDLIEKYLFKCINEFDIHLISNNQKLQVIKALLYERLGYCFGHCLYLDDKNLSLLNYEQPPEKIDDELFQNIHKLKPDKNTAIKGLTRFRKSSVWYIISIKEWFVLKNFKQIKLLLNNIKYIYNIDNDNDWYNRDDSLLGIINKSLVEFDHEDQLD